MADGFTGALAVRAEGLGQDEGADRREAEGDHRRARSTSSRARSTTRAGKLRVPKGKKMTLPQILSVDWLVKGIEGSPKG